MEEEKKKIEEQISKLINEFNERYRVEVCSIGLKYWRWKMYSETEGSKSVTIDLNVIDL